MMTPSSVLRENQSAADVIHVSRMLVVVEEITA